MTYQELQFDPKFKALSYDEQLEVRQHLLTQELPADPKFRALDSASQQQVFNHMLFAAPETTATTERSTAYKNLYNGIISGDPEAQKEGLSWLTGETIRDQLSIADLIAKGIGWADNLDGIDDRDREILGQERSVRQNELAGLRYALSQDAQYAKKARMRNLLATAGGALIDTALWYGVTQPFAMGLKAATGVNKVLGLVDDVGRIPAGKIPTSMNAFQKFAVNSINMPSNSLRFLRTRVVPEAFDGIRGGLIEVGRQNILDNVTARAEGDPSLWDTVAKNAAIFGEDFLLGMTMYAGLSAVTKTLKHTVGLGTSMKKLMKEGKLQGIMDDAEIQTELLVRAELGNLTEAEIKMAPKDLQEDLVRGVYRGQVRRNVDHLNPDSPDAVAVWASTNGVADVAPVKADPGMWHVFDEKAPEGIILTEDAMKARVGADYKAAIGTDVEALKHSAVAQDTLEIQQILQMRPKDMKKGLGLTDSELLGMTAPTKGRVNRNNIGYVARELLRKANLGEKTIDQVRVGSGDKLIKLTDDIEIKVPSSIKTLEQEEEYLKSMFKGLRKVVEKHSGDTKVLDEFESLLKVDRVNGEMTPMWVKLKYDGQGLKAATKPGTTEVIIKDQQGNVVDTYADWMTAGEDLFRKEMMGDPKNLHNAVVLNAREKFGVSIKETPDGRIIAKERAVQKTSKEVVYNSWDELLTTHPEFTPKTPNSQFPKWNIIDNNLDVIEVKSGVVTGDTNSVVTFADTFMNYERKIDNWKPLKTYKGRLLYEDKLTSKYVVTDTARNFTGEFADSVDAMKFLKKEFNSYEGLKDFASFKGADVYALNGKYYMYQAGDTAPRIFDNTETLKTAVNELPQAAYVGKDLLGLGKLSDVLERDISKHMPDSGPIKDHNFAVGAMIREGKKIKLGKEVERKINPMSSWFLDHFGPKDAAFKRFAADAQLPEYYKNMHAVRRGAQKAEGMSYRMIKDFDAAVTNKLTKVENRRLNELLLGKDAKESFEDAYRRLNDSEISSNELDAVKTTKDLFDSYQTTFGVDLWKYVTDYYPKIIQKSKEMGSEISETVPDMWKKAFGENAPKEVTFFANYTRIGDVRVSEGLGFLSDTAHYYIKNGSKSRVLGGTIEQADTWGKAHAKELSTEAHGAYNTYLDRIKGFYDDKDITNFNNAMYTTIKKTFKDLKMEGVISKVMSDSDIQNLMGFFNSLSISATMAYRPWPVIRNLFQPFNTLGLVVGQDMVMDSYKRAMKDIPKRVERLKMKGILTDKNHMLMYTSDTPFRKFTDKGLYAYQSAHNLNVAVTDAAAEICMERGLKVLNDTGDMDQFLRHSNLDRLPKQDSLVVTELLGEGKVDEATDALSELLVHQTQFPYKSHENPEAFQGLLGKLFGAYQHYPVYYTANMVKSAANGPMGVRLERIFSTAVTGAVAYGAFSQLLGINAKDFLFFTPVSFTGGPMWQMGNDILDLTSGGYEADVALEQIKRNVPSLMIPGAGMATSMVDAFSYLAEGDIQKFFIKGLSAPLGKNF